MSSMPARISRGEVLHQLGIFVDQRLAFGAIGDHEFHLGLRFHVRRESRPARAHHTAFAQFVGEHQDQNKRAGAETRRKSSRGTGPSGGGRGPTPRLEAYYFAAGDAGV